MEVDRNDRVPHTRVLVGITAFGILAVLFGSLMLIFLRPYLNESKSVQIVLLLLTAVFWVIFGIGILMRLSWARIGVIVVAAIYIFDTLRDAFESPSYLMIAVKTSHVPSLLIVAVGLIFFGLTIFFFTRPYVKEQFIKNKNKDEK